MDYEAIDREMSRRVRAIFCDPKRHQFHSEAEAYEGLDHRGPLGGRIRGRKRICFHCGHPPKGHAEETEQL